MMLRKRLFVLFLSLTFIIQPFHFSLNRKAQTETDEWISFKYARVFADNPIGSEVEAISKNLDASMINDLMEKDADAYVRSYYMFNQKRGTSENRNALCNDGGAQEIQPIILNLKNKKIVSIERCIHKKSNTNFLVIRNMSARREEHIIRIPVKNLSYDPKSGAIIIVRDDSYFDQGELVFKEIFFIYEQDVNKYAFNGYIPVYPIPVGPGDMPEIVSAYIETVDTQANDTIKGRRVRFVLKDAGVTIDHPNNAIPYEDALFFARIGEFTLATLLAAKKIDANNVSLVLKNYQDKSQLILLKLWQSMIDLGVFETLAKTKASGKDEAYYREHPQEFISLIPRVDQHFFTKENAPTRRSKFFNKNIVNVKDPEENDKNYIEKLNKDLQEELQRGITELTQNFDSFLRGFAEEVDSKGIPESFVEELARGTTTTGDEFDKMTEVFLSEREDYLGNYYRQETKKSFVVWAAIGIGLVTLVYAVPTLFRYKPMSFWSKAFGGWVRYSNYVAAYLATILKRVTGGTIKPNILSRLFENIELKASRTIYTVVPSSATFLVSMTKGALDIAVFVFLWDVIGRGLYANPQDTYDDHDRAAFTYRGSDDSHFFGIHKITMMRLLENLLAYAIIGNISEALQKRMFLIHMSKGFEFVITEIEKIRGRTSSFDLARLENILNETIAIEENGKIRIIGNPKPFLDALAQLNERLTPIYQEEFNAMIESLRIQQTNPHTTIRDLIAQIEHKEFLGQSNPQFRKHILNELHGNGYTPETKLRDVVKGAPGVKKGLLERLTSVFRDFQGTELPGQKFDIINYQKGKLAIDLNTAMIIEDGVVPTTGENFMAKGNGQNLAEIKGLLAGWKNALPRLRELVAMSQEDFSHWVAKLRARETTNWVDYASLVEYQEPTEKWFINTAKRTWNAGSEKLAFLHKKFLQFIGRNQNREPIGAGKVNQNLANAEVTLMKQFQDILNHYLIKPSKAGFKKAWDNVIFAWLSNVIPNIPNSGMLSQIPRGRIFSWEMFQFKRLILLPILLIPNFFLNSYFNELGFKGTVANMAWSFVYGQITGFIAQMFWNGMDMDQRISDEGMRNKKRIQEIGEFLNIIEHDPVWDPQ